MIVKESYLVQKYHIININNYKNIGSIILYTFKEWQMIENTDNSISYIATYAQVPIKDPGSIKPEIPIPTT